MLSNQIYKSTALTMDWNEMSFSETNESDHQITLNNDSKDKIVIQDQPVSQTAIKTKENTVQVSRIVLRFSYNIDY